MITPVSARPTNLINLALQNKQQSPPAQREPYHHTTSPRNTRASIFYVNDYHGKSINYERTITASNAFNNLKHTEPTDILKLGSGDFLLGEVESVNKAAIAAQNKIGISATAVGNHEYDMPDSIGKFIPDMKYRMLACNVKIKPENPLTKKIEKSFIEEHNGNKYGIIGISPTDLMSRLKYGKIFEEIEVSDINKTINEVQTEVDKLKSQGVDKIILLSHAGFGYDQKIAQSTDGIDVILGGHSHNLLQSVKTGENLVYSKSGEPVVITQAGRDGKHFGILNLEFNNKGVITQVQNNVTSSRGFKRNASARYIFDQILGKPRVIGKINSAPPPLVNDLTDPNGHANFIADSMKYTMGTDIALILSANIRGYFEPGDIDTRIIEDISPFKNKICSIKYTEKEIIDALKFSATSQVTQNNKPGILHTSGLKYEMSKDGRLLSAAFIDKNGKETPIDINNPRTDKLYAVAISDYHASGHDNYTMLNKIDKADRITDFDINKCIEDYIIAQGKPVDIIDDGRVRVQS